MIQCFLGLGSNLGERSAQMDRAVALLESHGCTLIAQSSDIENPALLPDDAPEDWDIPFKNRVIEVQCEHKPEALLKLVKQVEQEMGRQDRGRWAPREIDVDILAYGDQRILLDGLTIPHAELEKRDFVLGPWSEIAPNWMHPISGKTVAQMVEALS